MKETQEFQEMAARVWHEWRRIAPERMETYRVGDQEPSLNSISRYRWNVALCEALLPSFHVFEVAVRNSVHGSMAHAQKTEDWFHVPGMFEANEQTELEAAKRRIEQRGATVTAGRIVAEVTLGFWTALFSSPYEDRIVRPVLARGMSKIPPDHRTRHFVAAQLKTGRDLRNRAFHLEPIWAIPDLLHRQQMIGRFASWLFPLYTTLILTEDRFPEVFRQGVTPFCTDLETRIRSDTQQP